MLVFQQLLTFFKACCSISEADFALSCDGTCINACSYMQQPNMQLGSYQGTLTKGEGSAQLTSSLRKLAL